MEGISEEKITCDESTLATGRKLEQREVIRVPLVSSEVLVSFLVAKQLMSVLHLSPL